MTASTLILGIGNTLLSDEAVGIVVMRRLEEEGLPGAEFIDGGTLSFTLAGHIADFPRLIVVDAAATGSPPGTVRVFEGEEMDRQLGAKARSVHEVSLADLLDMARLTDTLPPRRALVGIEPAQVDWGDALSAPVAAAVPQAAAQVRALVSRWDAEAQGND